MEYKNTQHINILLKLNRIRKMLSLSLPLSQQLHINQKPLIQSTVFVVDVSLCGRTS